MKILIFLIAFSLTISYGKEALSQGEEKVDEMIDILNAILPPNPHRQIQLDEKSGKLFIRDTPSNHKIIGQIIKTLDEERAQIDIETRFVEFKLTDSDEIGINWGSTFLWYDWGPAPDVSPVPPESVPGRKVPRWRFRGINPTTGSVDDLIRFTTTTTTGMDLSIAKLNTNKLDLFIHALEKEGKANLLSSPKVTTISGRAADIQITTKHPYIEKEKVTYQQYQSGGQTFVLTLVEQTKADVVLGIKLNVTPTVGKAGIINLDLKPKVEVLLERLHTFEHVSANLGWPVVDTRGCETQVRIKNGETVVLGGLIEDDHKVDVKKVPVLGDIPLLGNLFRNRYVYRIKRNLLIFVTATLINPRGEAVFK